MKKILVFLLLFTNISSWSYANEVVQLSKGEAAPFSGFLLDREKVDKMYKLDADLTLSNTRVDILTRENTYLKTYLDSSERHIDNLSKQLTDAKDNSIWSKIGFFFLGSIATTIVAYGASRVVR
jgi:hypothetical protein